jgi:hypothetical protein
MLLCKPSNYLYLLALFSSMSCKAMILSINGKSQRQQTSGQAAIASTSTASVDTSKLKLPAKVSLQVNRQSVGPLLTTEAFKITSTTPARDLELRCGASFSQGYTAAAPASSFAITDDIDLSVRLIDGVDGILVFPDGKTVCNERSGQFLSTAWPKGNYHLFLISSGSSARGQLEFASASAARGAAPVLAANNATAKPMHATTGPINYLGSYSKVFSSDSLASCATMKVADTPAAFVDLKSPTPTTRISVWGDNSAGFATRINGINYLDCANSSTGPKGGWPAGRIEIFPLGNLDQPGNTFVIAVDDPETAATDSQIQEVTLPGKLAKPMFVSVALRSDRWQMPKDLLGADCGNNTFAGVSDLRLTLSRPIPGLAIVPLASGTTVRTLVMSKTIGGKMCPDAQRETTRHGGGHPNDTIGAFDSPTWSSDGTVFISEDGTYDLQIGAPAGATGSVTLMIYDESTALSPLEAFALDESTLGDREIARAYPQLNLARVRGKNYAGVQLAANLFSSAPKNMFVYPTIVLDSDLTSPTLSGLTMQEGTSLLAHEPLLLLDAKLGEILTADGLVIQVSPKYLSAKVPDVVELPTKPRPISTQEYTDAWFDKLAVLLPPNAKSVTAYAKAKQQFEKCSTAAYAPYQRRLPSIERPGGVQLVVVKNAAYQRIEEAGSRAVDAACGTEEAFNAKLEKMRKSTIAEFESLRPALLEKVRARF